MHFSVGSRDLTRLVPLALVLAAGCSAQKGPSVHLVLSRTASSDGRCAAGTGAVDPTVVSGNIDTVRVSVRTHSAANPDGAFACDRIFQTAGGAPPELKIPLDGADTVDIIAEGFRTVTDGNSAMAGNFRRVAVGSLYGVSTKLKTLPNVVLYPTESAGCVDARLTQPRAFHSATQLPNGQVLFVGGLAAASGTDPTTEQIGSNLLFAVGSAEIYDPATGQFTMVTESPAPAPRAFHNAVLLNDTPPYQILLVGGVTTAMPSQPVLSVSTSGAGPRLQPIDFTSLATLGAQAAGAEVLTYDPEKMTGTRATATGWPEAAFAAGLPLKGGLAVAGGVEYAGTAGNAAPVNEVAVQASTDGNPRMGALGAARLGATLTQLSPSAAIVLGGGNLATDPFAELMTGLDQGLVGASPVPSPAGAVMTQFHTATALGAPQGGIVDILMTGGFQVDAAGIAVQPPLATSAVRLITANASGALTTASAAFAGGYVADATCANAMRYRPAGWESAAVVTRGRVLITGGAPTYKSGTCDDCPTGAANLLCAIPQTSIYTPSSSSIAPSGSLQLGRLGHSSTVLADGNVLIVGGITSVPGGNISRFAADAEVFDPHSFVPPVNITLTSPVDADDPLAEDLASDMLLRVPGGQAYAVGSVATKPARSCGSL